MSTTNTQKHPVQTRSQEVLRKAIQCVSEVKEGKEAKDYKIVCQSFPIFVRTCGLCQAVAFSESKAAGDGATGKAHKLLLKHLSQILGLGDGGRLLNEVQRADTLHYMELTHQVLEATLYLKRFAEATIVDATATDTTEGGK